MSLPMRARLVFLCLIAAAAAFAYSASGQVAPRESSNLDGRKLWTSKRIVGPGGQTCATCHDPGGGVPLDPETLASRGSRLESLVFYEVVTKSRNRMVQLDGPEVRALTQHLVERYRLDEIATEVATEVTAAREALQLARSYYSEGLLDRSIGLLLSSQRLRVSPSLHAEGRVLLGCIYYVQGKETDARTQFAEALRLDPEAMIDEDVFSPKTVELFETVRGELPSTASPVEG